MPLRYPLIDEVPWRTEGIHKMTKSEFLTWSIRAAEYRDSAIARKVKIEEYEKKIKEQANWNFVIFSESQGGFL